MLLCRCALLCLLYFRAYQVEHIKIRNQVPTWGMYVRAASARDAKRMWRPSCFLLKHGGGTLGIIKPPVCNYDHPRKKLYQVYIYILLIPFIIFAHLLSLLPTRNSDPGSHNRLFSPLSATVRAFIFNHGTFVRFE